MKHGSALLHHLPHTQTAIIRSQTPRTRTPHAVRALQSLPPMLETNGGEGEVPSARALWWLRGGGECAAGCGMGMRRGPERLLVSAGPLWAVWPVCFGGILAGFGAIHCISVEILCKYCMSAVSRPYAGCFKVAGLSRIA